MTDTRRRVKLYALNAERQWDDRGTGHVSSSYVDRLKGTSLLVRAESDGSLLLESKIQPDTAYQKQQDTLIVWSEGDNFDLALSFQEKAGCDEIWEKICQVQGKDPSVEITQDIVEESEDERFDDMSDGSSPIELPPCELPCLEDISALISNCLGSPARKDKLAMALESENYIKKLLNLFHMCEDLENTEGLHHLFDIFKNISLLNKTTLFETMFAEETIFDVIGCLEYDPSLTQPKKHREYLRKLAKFREAIPIKNPELLAKIHQTFRVQYIQDIVLPAPSVFEDNVLSTLSSFIFFKKVEIVKMIEEDEKFLIDLFKLLTDEKTLDSKRRDLVLFLKECCNFSQNLQPHDKDTFNKTLVSHGILPALEITLTIDDPETKTASIDILTYIVEFSPSVIRDYTFQQANNTDEDQLFLNIVIEQMLRDTDPELGGAVQLMGVLRILLDPENMLASVNKSEKTDFLYFFYKHSVHTLIAPLLANTCGDRPLREDYHTVQLLGLVLELLSFCVEHHTYHIKNCILNKDLLRRILVLMKSIHTFLKLGALRFLRKIIALKDEIYNRYIIKGNLFAPVIDAFLRNNGRYNLLESAILEMFEFIKVEDIKSLCSYVVENFSKILDEVEYVQTFKALKTRYERQQEKMKDRDRGNSDTAVPSIMRASRYRRDQRQLDEDEEMWLNDEEESYEEEPAPVGRSQIAEQMQISQSHTAAARADEDSAAEDRNSDGKYERTFSPEYDPPDSPNGTAESSEACEGELSPGDGGDAQPPLEAHASAKTANKKGLVDYDVDSEEEEEESSLSDSGEESSPRAGTSGSVAADDAALNGSSLDGAQSADDVKTTIQHNGESLVPPVSDDNDNATPALSSEELAQLNTENESKDDSGDLKRKSLDDEPPQTEVEATTESTRKTDREAEVEDEIESDAKRQRLE